MRKKWRKTILQTLTLLLAFMIVGCNHADSSLPCEQDASQAGPCTHAYSVVEKRDALALKEGFLTRICEKCGETDSQVLPATDSIKILAVGNSFSTDAMQYLWQICKDAGISEVILGNLYIGGCSLDTHATNIKYNLGAYEYYKNTDGSWSKKENFRVSTALAEENWDFITVQQTSKTCGLPETYSALHSILDFLDLNKTNPNAKLYFHMTWAYQQDSTHASFPNYNKDQMTMYQMIVDTVESAVLTDWLVSGVIPAGTAIQNLRSSYVGDTVTRDGYHMSHDYGRYTVAMTWYACLTGGSPDAVDWVPEEQSHLAGNLAVIRESVNHALEAPYTVTPSQHLSKP